MVVAEVNTLTHCSPKQVQTYNIMHQPFIHVTCFVTLPVINLLTSNLNYSTILTRYQKYLTKGQYASILSKLMSGRHRHMETFSTFSIPPSPHPFCWRNSQPSLQVAGLPRPAEHVFSSPGRVKVRSFIHSQWYSSPDSPACILIMCRTLATDDEFHSADR